MRKTWLVAAVVVAVCGAALGQVTVTSITTMKDVQTDYAAGKWADCLKKISLVLPQTTTSPQDRVTLLTMKAECLLESKQATPAADAFAAASTAYMAPGIKDPKTAATMKATSDLIKASQDYSYVPKTGKDRTGLPIIAPASRPAALTAYFADQLSSVQDGIKALGTNMSVQAVLDFAPKLTELEKLELAATSDDKQTVTLQKNLALTMKTAMDSFITAGSKTVDGIAASAAAMVPAGRQQGQQGGARQRGGGGNTQKGGPQVERGLSDSDKQKLQELETDAEKIPTNAKPLAVALGMDADYYKAEVASVATLKGRIDAVLGGKFK